jgi:hypothetical protein
MKHVKLILTSFVVALSLGCDAYCYLFVGGACGCSPCRSTGHVVVELQVGTTPEDAEALASAHGCVVDGEVLPANEQTEETRPRLSCSEVCTERSDGVDEVGPAVEALEEELSDVEMVEDIRVETLSAC